ncbi:Ankyrin repeat and KH domain-containing protein 1 [Hondaea fermentalgiana]|uniref:Ankyrin repeat and KH domain-containing protein 1 n=1 Tax=Hondaea fermentalgiana TaxID=2315210 RepID=A0A2R5G716_9STRA|nr:Ankyrin repeat and KH domain-containing protein 1 [Hondaea fermentalgiana]|eukprot:GBG24253.1 Ankyrin repeat and KH domain-containing protein 1 [Hondaea fermentalgiana]
MSDRASKKLEQENEALRQELEDLRRQTGGPSTGDSWSAFKRLLPSARKKVASQYKPPKEGRKEVTAFLEAAKNGEAEEVERLLIAGVPVDVIAPWEFGQTALHMAATWGHTHTLELLLANRADVDKRDDNGETALYKSAQWGRLETVNALIAHGARIDIPAKRTKQTPLMVAASRGQVEVCVVLVREGASARSMDANGMTALQCARASDQEEAAVAIETTLEQRRKSKAIDPTQL